MCFKLLSEFLNKSNIYRSEYGLPIFSMMMCVSYQIIFNEHFLVFQNEQLS